MAKMVALHQLPAAVAPELASHRSPPFPFSPRALTWASLALSFHLSAEQASALDT